MNQCEEVNLPQSIGNPITDVLIVLYTLVEIVFVAWGYTAHNLKKSGAE